VSASSGDDPRWVQDAAGEAAPDPLAVYAQTYTAMSGAPAPRRSRRRPLVALAACLVVGLGLVAVATRGRAPALLSRADAPSAAKILPTPRSAFAPDVIGTTPVRPKATVRVGEERQFAVAATGPDLRYGWTVDGTPAGTGPSWTYVPRVGDVGRRRIEVAVAARDGTERRVWVVRVKAARPPDLVLAEPASPNLSVEARSPVELRVRAEPRAGEHLRTTWQVDGAVAGEGETFTLRSEHTGTRVVRATVQSDLGPATRLEWRVTAYPPEREPEPPPTQVASLPEPPPPPPVVQPAEPPPPSPAKDDAAASPPPSLAKDAAAPPLPAREPQPEVARRRSPAAAPGATAGIRFGAREPERPASREEEVRVWLERYAAAWRAHDVDALRRMGQVTTDGEVAALRAYFETVRELDVELNVIALRAEGDRVTVRFTRRDRFRDPAGRLVLKESPTLEKEIVRTPAGLRFVRPTG
jgi:hypothetical protein